MQIKQLHKVSIQNFLVHVVSQSQRQNRASSSFGDHIGKSVPNKNRSGPNRSNIRSTISRGIIGSVLDVSYNTQLGSGHSYECSHASPAAKVRGDDLQVGNLPEQIQKPLGR